MKLKKDLQSIELFFYWNIEILKYWIIKLLNY
jgi:hypothetical protein